MAKAKSAPAPAAGGVTIVELRAKNMLRLSAVTIRPTGPGLVEITGRNDQGKTSVLRAVRAAMEGKRGVPFGGLKDGAEEGFVFADCGRLKVRRVVKRTKDGEDWDLAVSLDGKAVTKRPHDVLQSFLGALSFDPLAARNLKPKEQADLLKALVPGFDFAGNAEARATAFADRTEVGRERDRARGAAEKVAAELPAGPRPEPVDVGARLRDLKAAMDANAAQEARRARRVAAAAEVERKLDEAEQLRARAATLEKEAAATQAALDEGERKNPTVKPVDLAPIQADLDEADRVNAVARLHDQRATHEREADWHVAEFDRLTVEIEQLDREKREAIIDADLPVEGLSLGDDVVLYDGRPLSEAAKSIQIRTWMSVAMALNPALRVVLVDEGSELDGESRALVHEMAAEKGYEVWICRVTDGDPAGFVIEDGQLAGAK